MKRRIVAAIIGVGLVGLMGYRVVEPVAGAWTGMVALTVLTAVLLAVIRGSEAVDPHQYALSQKKSYRITYRSSVATALLTGVVVLALLLFTGAVIGIVTAVAGYEPYSATVLADALERVAAVLQLPGPTLLGAGAAIAAALGTGFWLLFPYIPGDDEMRAAPVTFAATWLYLGAAATVVDPGLVPEPATFVLDTALVALWGHFFAVAYVDVERYVP